MPISARRLRQTQSLSVPAELPPFPGSSDALQALLPSEAACVAHLERVRWPYGFVCPRCRQPGEPFRHRDRPLAVTCRHCRRRLSLAAETPMAHSHLPISLWFRAAFLAATAAPDWTIGDWQERLGLSRAATAAGVLDALHHAMAFADRAKIGAAPAWVLTAMLQGGKRQPALGAALEMRSWRPDAETGPEILEPGRLRLTTLTDPEIGRIRFLDQAVIRDPREPLTWVEYSRDRPILGDSAITTVLSALAAWLDRGGRRPGPSGLDRQLIVFQFRYNRRRDPWRAVHDSLGLAPILPGI